MSPGERLSPRARKLLERVQRLGSNGLLEAQIVASGDSKVLDELLRAGLVDMIAHPTVRAGKAPAAAVIPRQQDTNT
jgi:hypothetical protein